MQQVVVGCLTLCVVLLWAFSRALPITSWVMGCAFNLICMLFVVVGALLGAVEREVGIIVLPLAWLVGNTTAAYLKRVEMDDLDERFGLPKRTGKWCCYVSLGSLVVAYWWFYGFGNGVVILFVVYQGVKIVYGWLR